MIQYTVKKCDSLWKIARNYNVSLESIIAANPQIADPNFILPGTIINVPELWQPKPGYPYDRERAHKYNNDMPKNYNNGNNQIPYQDHSNNNMNNYNQQEKNNYYSNQIPYQDHSNNNMNNYNQQEKKKNNYYSNQMPKNQYKYESEQVNGNNNCTKDSPRPCIYEATAGETLEQICRKFMIPLTRLLYYNLKYCKNEPLDQGTRIIIPEYNMTCPNSTNTNHNYYNNK